MSKAQFFDTGAVSEGGSLSRTSGPSQPNPSAIGPTFNGTNYDDRLFGGTVGVTGVAGVTVLCSVQPKPKPGEKPKPTQELIAEGRKGYDDIIEYTYSQPEGTDNLATVRGIFAKVKPGDHYLLPPLDSQPFKPPVFFAPWSP